MLYGKVCGKMYKELKERTLPGTVTCLSNVHPLFLPHQYVFDFAGDNVPSLKLNFLDSHAPEFPPDTLLENKPGEGIGQGELWFYSIGNTLLILLLPSSSQCPILLCCFQIQQLPSEHEDKDYTERTAQEKEEKRPRHL